MELGPFQQKRYKRTLCIIKIMIKRKWITVLFCCLLLLLSISVNVQARPQDLPRVNAQVTGRYRFDCLVQDGYIDGDGWDMGYGDVRNVSDWLSIGYDETIPFHIYKYMRSYVYFNTSSLNDNGILSATLWLFQSDASYGARFGIRIMNGQPTYPHFPLKGSDFNKNHYSGNGGESLYPLDWTWFPIILTDEGVSWINRTGITKFTLRADYEVDGYNPYIGDRWTSFVDSENVTYAPFLIVDLGRRSTSNMVFLAFGYVGGIVIGVLTGLAQYRRNVE